MATARRDGRRPRLARREGGNTGRNPIRFLSLSAALSTVLASPAWAARWEIVPTLAVQETYTDNLSLSTDATKQADWVTQVTPGVSLAATGPELRFSLNYTPQLTYYRRNEEDNTVLQRGNATGNAELVKQWLLLDFGAAVDQYNVSVQDPLTTSNINTTGNLSTTKTYFVSPYLVRNLGSSVQAEARFTYSVANSDDSSALADSEGQRIHLRVASGPAYKLLTWDLTYSKEYINYDDSQNDTDSEVVLANARRLITPTFGLLASAGYENYAYRAVGPESGGSRWSAGFEWTPTPRTRLAATAGERFYGDAYYFDFRHRTRLTTWSAGYTENVTSTRSEFFVPVTNSTAGYLDPLFLSQFPDPVARQKAVDEFISRTGLPPSLNAPVNFFTEQLFLEKRWQGSVGLLGVKNVIIASVFGMTRDALAGNIVVPSSADFAASNNIKQTGATLAWNWRMTERNAWNLAASYARVDFVDSDRLDKLVYINAGLTRQFRPRLSGSLYYRRQQDDSTQSGSSYTENAGIAALQMRF